MSTSLIVTLILGFAGSSGLLAVSGQKTASTVAAAIAFMGLMFGAYCRTEIFDEILRRKTEDAERLTAPIVDRMMPTITTSTIPK